MSPVCVLCTSIHTVAPDVLLKYSIAEVVGGSWIECSQCLGPSDHQVHDNLLWYTTCVEGAILFSTSSVNSVKEVKEYCDRDGKENFLPATVSRNTEIPERK